MINLLSSEQPIDTNEVGEITFSALLEANDLKTIVSNHNKLLSQIEKF